MPGNRGYKYFGAAKDLPGVRELFEQEPPPPPRKTRGELMRDVDADYYGYRDDDDGILVPLEEKAERTAILEAVKAWKSKQQSGQEEAEDEEDIYPVDEEVCLILLIILGSYFDLIYFTVRSSRQASDGRGSTRSIGSQVYSPCARAFAKGH